MTGDAGATSGAGPQAPAGDDDPQAPAGGANEGAVPDRLSFLDLFYSLPVGDLAVRVGDAHLGKVTAAAWTTMAVELAALLFSWLGLHQNRATMVGREVPEWWVTKMSFVSARFVQFSVEVAITALYFVIGLTIHLTPNSTPAGNEQPNLPSATWIVTTILVIYGAYLVWDVLDAYIAAKHDDGDWLWTTGGVVTAVFTAGLLIVFIVIEVTHAPKADSSITSLNFGLIALLYGYRVAQERVEAWVETWADKATGWDKHPRAFWIVCWSWRITRRTGRIMNRAARLLTRGKEVVA